MIITIALCTRQRPKMLTSCLTSIQSLTIPKGCSLNVALVENNDKNSCEAIASSIMKSSTNIGFSYTLEQSLGISFARNTSIELALETNPDWIAFIDDDETVAEDWLTKFVNAINTDSADVYTGSVDYISLEEIPIWYKLPATHRYEHMSIQPTASTGNTIVNSAFFDGRRKKLRFDDSHQFSGAEDTELFANLVNEGGVIRYVSDAIVRETVVSERTSVKWVIAREFSYGNNSARQHINFKGKLSAVSYFSKDVLASIFKGFTLIIWGILILPFTKRSLRYIVKGLKKISWSIGVVTGFTNISYNRYKKIQGF